MSFASFKNARVVRSSWLEEGGRRLDCNPYMSGALEARDALKLLSAPKEKLSTVTSRIFHAGREGRLWVDDPRYGVPFLGSSDILSADLSNLPLMSKKRIEHNPLFTLREGWTLITRSGTIGRMAYVRPDMAGMACSEHVLRVVPDISRVPPGYLFAFLSSRFGVPLVVSGTYGAIIQHIEPEHIAMLDVPRFDNDFESEVHSKVESAAKLREAAARKLREVADEFDQLFPDLVLDATAKLEVSSIPASEVQARLDAQFHNPLAVIIRTILGNAAHTAISDYCDSIFLPGIFKRIHVEGPEFAAPYYTGSSLFWNEPEPKGYLSRVTKLFDQVRLKEGMILVQAFGQEGGLTGRPVWVGKYLNDATTTHMLVRLLVKQQEKAAYLFGFLNSKLAYKQISCLTFGGSIPHFDEAAMKTVLVPRLGVDREQAIAVKVLEVVSARDEALRLEREARKDVETLISGVN